MRGDYFSQLRKRLEPENASLQSRSRSKSIAANSHSGSQGNSVTKIKQDLFRNQRAQDSSFSSFDTAALIPN
jgi:hypothetical protein